MSFDIIILNPSKTTTADLTEVEAISPLGSFETVSQLFNSTFPGCLEGGFLHGENYSVELSLRGLPVESAHLSLRFGQSWDIQGEVDFHKSLTSVCCSVGWVAFVVSDNSRIAP